MLLKELSLWDKEVFLFPVNGELKHRKQNDDSNQKLEFHARKPPNSQENFFSKEIQINFFFLSEIFDKQ